MAEKFEVIPKLYCLQYSIIDSKENFKIKTDIDDDAIDQDELIFNDEVEESASDEKNCWKIMVVDDEQEIHNVTRLALQDFSYGEKGLDIISAFSGRQARQMINDHPDTAVIFLDVIMEEDSSGLDVARYIREELGNDIVRIILRTGQPGQAPERRIIVDYDINDYKAKTELTNQKLFTTLVASLRSYQHLLNIDASRRGLEKIIEAFSSLYKLQSLENFISGVLTQLVVLLDLNESSMYCQTTGFATRFSEGDLKIIAGTGVYAGKINDKVINVASEDTMKELASVVNAKCSLFLDDRCIIYFHTKDSGYNIIYLEKTPRLTKCDKYLLELFSKNINVALENLHFH